MNTRIVVIGATGHFGGRICRRLLCQENITLLPASRNLDKARSLVDQLSNASSQARPEAAGLDQFAPTFESDLGRLEPDIVIHTAGPYQGQDYTVAKACIGCGCHYLDLADGRRFVSEFEHLNREAEDKGVLLVSGASTLPGLSSAVIDMLKPRFSSIDGIEISIAPAHQTPRGTGTVAAVLSYCGKPFDVVKNGRLTTVYGWQDMKVQRYPNLRTRLSGACDVPDLELLSSYAGNPSTVTFHAALEAKWEQIALWLMAGLTRIGIVSNWRRMVPAFRWVSDKMIGFGSDTGGMHIRVSGRNTDGVVASVVWHLTARQNHGPEIPCTPALILARKLAAGEITARGAKPCLGLITMDEFDEEVDDLDIEWSVSEEV